MNFKELWINVFINEMKMSDVNEIDICALVADKAVAEYKKRVELLSKDDVDMSIKNQLYIFSATAKFNENRCDLPGCILHDPEKKKSNEDTH